MTATPTRVVILGGGFGALAVARHLERALPPDGSIDVTLASRTNYLLYTPMLAEVASGALEPRHIATPLRAFLRRVRVWQCEATAVDLEKRVVTVQHAASNETETLPYDHLVLALGSVVSYHNVPGAEQYSFPFKELGDASTIRDRIIDCFEQAAIDHDPVRRRELLTFVVSGGGFSGVELAASLADFLREMRCYYPRLANEKVYLVLAHHGHRLLEELSEAAAAYTLGILKREGIAVRLGTAVTAVTDRSVELSPGGTIPTRTVLWTAGIAPSPLVESLPLPKDQHGAVIVDGHLAVQDHPGIWALGDCAHVPDVRHGGTYGPLAQNAEQEGPVVARNILASLRGAPLETFDYRTIGQFASLGKRTAVAQALGQQFSGSLAWLAWRTVYLAKLPGNDRRVRVALDWALDFIFPVDVVSTRSRGYALAPAQPAPAPASPSGAAASPRRRTRAAGQPRPATADS
jgi:NADH dehydrogenase